MNNFDRRLSREQLEKMSNSELQTYIEFSDPEDRQIAANILSYRLEQGIQQPSRDESKYKYTLENNKSIYTDYDNLLTDDVIKKLILKKSCPFWPVLLFTFGLPAAVTFSPLAYMIPYVYEYSIIIYILLAIIIGAISFACHSGALKKTQKFADENYKNAQLFLTVSPSTHCVRRHSDRLSHGYDYYITALDEKGKKVEYHVSEEEYGWVKASTHKKIYMLKVPKYKQGYYYEFFIYDLFKNESSIVEKPINEVI